MAKKEEMIDLKDFIKKFFIYVLDKKIEIYNEFSFQHELGIFLRNELEPKGFKIQFERNVDYFHISKAETIKKEIDITIFKEEQEECYAIELKYPRNGQYPMQMYKFVEDIRFIEQLKVNGFASTCAVTLVDDAKFYENGKKTGIYKYFRTKTKLNGKIDKPTASKDGPDFIPIDGSYTIDWKPIGDRKYYIVRI